MYWLIAALVIAGLIAVFVSSRQALKRAIAELRQHAESLSTRVSALEQAGNAQSSRVMAGSEKLASGGLSQAPVTDGRHTPDEITPETLATIKETVSALLGRKVRVRSVKLLPTPDAMANPWAQQGRAVIQASHNFSQRKREP